jgi:hypothetical protein
MVVRIRLLPFISNRASSPDERSLARSASGPLRPVGNCSSPHFSKVFPKPDRSGGFPHPGGLPPQTVRSEGSVRRARTGSLPGPDSPRAAGSDRCALVHRCNHRIHKGARMWHTGRMAQIVCPLVSAADRARLETIVADRNRAQKHVARARIILGSAARLSVAEVARRAGVGRPAVWRWQRRFVDAGVDGCQCRTNFPHTCQSKFPQVTASAIRWWLALGLSAWAACRAGAVSAAAA